MAHGVLKEHIAVGIADYIVTGDNSQINRFHECDHKTRACYNIQRLLLSELPAWLASSSINAYKILFVGIMPLETQQVKSSFETS